MKKAFSVFVVLLIISATLCSCNFLPSGTDKSENIIPEQNISYEKFTMGNVIDEGKRAIFINFSSDYAVSKIEVAGSFLDINGNEVYKFSINKEFTTQTKNPEIYERIDAKLTNNIYSIKFTTIKAFTTETINS